MSDRIREILGWYRSENPGVLTNISRLLNHGRLGGTGHLIILPVDQGFEHGPARSFAPNPPSYDPLYHFQLAIDAGLNGFASLLGFLEAGAAEFAGQVPLILKLNSHDLLHPEQDPLGAQTASVRDALRLGCVAVGYTIYPGTLERRLQYEQLRELAEEAKAAGLVVVVWSYPRGGGLSKDGETALDVTAYAAHIAAQLGAHIIKIKLPTAHLELEEARKGKLQRAKDGFWNGNIPLGYCRGLCSKCDDPNGPGYCPDVGKPDKSDGKILVPHPIDSKAVQMAFDLYMNDTPNDVVIAEQLNQTTFIGPGGTEQPYRQRSIRGRKEPGPFTKDFVRGILNQIFYTGKVPYFGIAKPRRLQALYPGRHPALISEDVFQETQEIRSAIAGIALMRGNTPQRIYPLTGRIFCGNCGYPMRGSTQNPRNTHVYKDSGRIERRDVCSAPSPKAIPLEKEVAELLLKAIQRWEKSVRPDALALDVREAEAQLQRAQELYIRGEVTKDVVEREKERVENLIQPLQEQKFTATLSLVKKLQPALANWSKVTTIEQKRLLRLVIEAIFVREAAIVAVQPSFAFLPILRTLCQESSNSGPDGIRVRGA